MKILHILPYFYPAMTFGGIVRAAFDIALEQARQGHSVTVITTDAFDINKRVSGQKEKPFDDLDVTILRCKNFSNFLAYNFQLYLPMGFSGILQKPLTNCEVVHLHGNRNLLNYLAVKAARKLGKRIVFSPHGTMENFETKIFLKKAFDYFFNHQVISSVNTFIAVSEKEKEEIINQGIEAEKIKLIYNPLNIKNISHSIDVKETLGFHNRKVITFLGRLSKTKGLTFFVDVLNALETKNLLFVVAGNDMGYKKEITEKLNTLNIPWQDISLTSIAGKNNAFDNVREVDAVDKVVQFTGFIDGEIKNSLLASSDIFVYPSEKEIFGLSPFEAIQNNTPVIVSEESGCGEMIKKAQCGYTLSFGDIHSWKSTLEKVLEEQNNIKPMMEKGQSFIKKELDVSVVVEKLIDSYKGID
ncbi:MAG: glycosyltransferase family 4 protein [Nitrospinae bacterium]|nr:glycosyltransferase family 4 protein [Nitrospinota bacterium]